MLLWEWICLQVFISVFSTFCQFHKSTAWQHAHEATVVENHMAVNFKIVEIYLKYPQVVMLSGIKYFWSKVFDYMFKYLLDTNS